jgi:hypothetical protein
MWAGDVLYRTLNIPESGSCGAGAPSFAEGACFLRPKQRVG